MTAAELDYRTLAHQAVCALHIYKHAGMKKPNFEQCTENLCGYWHALEKHQTPASEAAKADWRIGLAVTPKMRAHPYWHVIFVVRAIYADKDKLQLEHYVIGDDHTLLIEPADDWMTA